MNSRWIAGLLAALAFGTLFASTACARSTPVTTPPVEPYPIASSGYQLVSLDGVSLEVPSHWTSLTPETIHNLNLAGGAVSEAAGMAGVDGKLTLFAMNATPNPPGAIIRISREDNLDGLTQEMIGTATPADLIGAGEEFERVFRTGLPLFESLLGVEKVGVSGLWSLRVTYERRDVSGPGNWQVDQYMVPGEGKTLWRITLSRRIQDRQVWDPILERVRKSIRLTTQ